MTSGVRLIMRFGRLGAVVAAIAAAPSLGANYTTVDLSSYANRSWAADWGVTTFPIGAQALNGTPFILPADSYTRYASVYGTVPGGAPGTITIATDVARATSAYSLINTIWGQAVSGLLSISFIGSGGATQSFDLVGNTDVRDFNNYAYTNTINGTTTKNAVLVDSGQHRLDEQTYTLNSAFLTQDITSVIIRDNGADGYSRGALSGLTFATSDAPGAVAEPASWALMLAGFAVVGGTLRRRASATVVAA